MPTESPPPAGNMRPAARALFPSGVVGVELCDPDQAEALFPEEEAFIANAVDKRRREFALGRTAARKALALLGIAGTPLRQNADRSVEWPAQAWGSITHADGYCAAVAVPRTGLSGIGIDAEINGRVHSHLWPRIANPREIAWLERAAGDEEARSRGTLLFSAKEAFYKAQFCVTRAWMGFHDAEVDFEASDGELARVGRFTVTVVADVAVGLDRHSRYSGGWCLLDAHVVTGVGIPLR